MEKSTGNVHEMKVVGTECNQNGCMRRDFNISLLWVTLCQQNLLRKATCVNVEDAVMKNFSKLRDRKYLRTSTSYTLTVRTHICLAALMDLSH
jgi:hypothetical protein